MGKRKIRCNATDVNPGGACEYNSGEECGPVSHGKLIVVGKSKQTCASKQKIKNDVRVNFDFNDTAKTGTLVVDVSSKSQFEAPIFEQDVSLFVSQWLSSTGANRARASITKLDIVNKKTKGGPVPYKFVAKFRTDTDVVQQPANQQCRPCCGQWSAWTSCNRPSKCKTGQRFSIFLESNKTKGHRKCPNFVSKQCGQTCTTTIKNTQTTPTTTTSTPTTTTPHHTTPHHTTPHHTTPHHHTAPHRTTPHHTNQRPTPTIQHPTPTNQHPTP